MKNLIFILSLAFLILNPAISNGQLGNFIRNKASKAITNLSKEKAAEPEKGVDTSATKGAETVPNDTAVPQTIENSNSQEQKPPAGMDFTKLFGGKVDLEYKDEYRFTSRLFMVTETYTKKEVMKMELYLYFSANSPFVGMETKSFSDNQGNNVPMGPTMVMDGENKCFIILSDINGTKMGMISAIPDEKSLPATKENSTSKAPTTSFVKTGNNKVIAGYRCDEYSYSDSENKLTGKVWFTKDASLKIDKRGWQKTGMSNYYGYSEFEGGILLGSEAYDEKGVLTMKSETKEITPNFDHTIIIKGATMRQMNFNVGGKER
jgi:hypothetical protein